MHLKIGLTQSPHSVDKSKQRQWLEEKGLYNVRLDTGNLSNIKSASYLLLRSGNILEASNIWKITKEPKSMSDQDLINKGYQNPSCNNYLVYNIEKIQNNEFNDMTWDIEKIPSYKTNEGDKYKPFAITLLELLETKTL